jgi:hypothetical protein
MGLEGPQFINGRGYFIIPRKVQTGAAAQPGFGRMCVGDKTAGP